MTRQSGSALVLALGALVVVAAAVLLMASQLESQQAAVRHDTRHLVLGTLADAAFAEALALLADDPGFVGAPARSFDRGTIASTVVPVGETSRQVVALASYQGWFATIEAEVDVAAGPRIVRLHRTQRPARGEP